MPRNVDPGNIRVGKGTAPEGTVEDNSFRYPERDVDPLRVHIQDPSRAHMAEAIGIVDANECFVSDEVEGALGELCSSAGAGRLNGLVAGGTFVETFPHAGLTLTLVNGTEIMTGGSVIDASGFTVTLPAVDDTYYIYMDADPASPYYRTLQATTGAPPEVETSGGVENVMIASVDVTTGGTFTDNYVDARFFVRNLDRKVQYSSRQGENVDAWSEGCFATLEAAMFWMQFYGDAGTSEDEKGTLLIRGTHTLSTTLTIPTDHLRFVGDGEAIIEADVSVTTRLILIDTTVADRADIAFQGITFQTDVVGLTCIEASGANALSDLRIEGCRFTAPPTGGTQVFDTCVALATGTSGVVLRDNTFVAEQDAVDATSGSPNVGLMVENNQFVAAVDPAGSAVVVDSPTRASLLNNVVTPVGKTSWGDGFLLTQALDTRVVGNTFLGCARGVTLRDGGSGVSVLDNVFTTGVNTGIQVDQLDLSISPVASAVSIHHNTFKGLDGPAVAFLSSLEATLDIANYGGLAPGDVISVNGFPLTGVNVPRTPGANDFQINAGNASAVASNIVAAITDVVNQFSARGITASSGPGSSEVSFTTSNPYAGAAVLAVTVTNPGAITVSDHGLAIQGVSVVENEILDVCNESSPTTYRSAIEVLSHNSNTGRADNLKIADNAILGHAATQAHAIGVYVWNADLRDSDFSGNTINGLDGDASPGGGIHVACRSSDFALRDVQRVHMDRNSMWVSGDVGVATATLTVTGPVANGETITLGGAVLTASTSQTNGGNDFDEGAGTDPAVAASIADAINASNNDTAGIVRAEASGALVTVFAGSLYPGSLGRLVQVSTTSGNIAITGTITSLNGNEYLTPPDWSATQVPGHQATFRLFLLNQPSPGDTIGFDYPDGSSETWEWNGVGPYPVTIGVNAAASAANFVAAVNANSTQVQAYLDPRDSNGLNIIIEARDGTGAWPGVVGNRIQVDGVGAAGSPFDASGAFILGSTDGYFSFGEDFGLHGASQEVGGQVSLLTTDENTVQIQSVLTSDFHRPHYLRTLNPNGSYITGAFATGSLTFTAGVVDGDTFTIDDGPAPAFGNTVTFEFDDNGVVTPGNVSIDILGLSTATEFRDAALNAIQSVYAAGGLFTSASASGVDAIILSAPLPGTAFNGDGPTTGTPPQVVAVAYSGGVNGTVTVVNVGSRNVQITGNQFYGGIGSRIECFDGMLLRDLMWSNNQSRGLDPSGVSAFLWNNDPNREYGFSLILRSTFPAPFSTENTIPLRSVNVSGNQFTDLPGGAVGIHHNEFRSMFAGVYTGIVINDNNVGNCGSNGRNPEVISVTMYGNLDLPTLYGSEVSNNTVESSVATRLGNRRPSQVEATGFQLSGDTGLCEAAILRVDSFIAAQGVSTTGNRIIGGQVTAQGVGGDLHVSCHGIVVNPGISASLAQTAQNLVVSDNHVYGLDLVAGNDGNDANAVWVSHLAIMEPGLVTPTSAPLALLEGSRIDGNNVVEPLAADPGTSSTTLVTDQNGILAGVLINVGTLSKVSTSNNRVSNSRKDLGVGLPDPTGPLNFDNNITPGGDPAMGGIVILSAAVDMVTVNDNIIRNRGQGGVTDQKPQMGVLVYAATMTNSTMSNNDIRLEDVIAASRSRCVLLHTVLATLNFTFSGNTLWNGAFPITSFPPAYGNEDGKGLHITCPTIDLTQVVGNSAFTSGPCYIFVDTATGSNVSVDGLTFGNNTGTYGGNANSNYGDAVFVLGPGTLAGGAFTGNVLTALQPGRYGFNFGSTTLNAQTFTGNIVTSPAGAANGGNAPGAPGSPSPRGTCVANQYIDTSGGGGGTTWTTWAGPTPAPHRIAQVANNDT